MRRLLCWVSQLDCQQTSMLCFLAPAMQMHGLSSSYIGEKGIGIWPHSVCSALYGREGAAPTPLPPSPFPEGGGGLKAAE